MTTPVRPVSTVEALTSALRERLLAGELAPGTPLREQDLAEAYRVGRHSVRAALQALAHEGLVRREPNRGASVPELAAGDVADIARLRAALEVEAIRAVFAAGAVPEAMAEAVSRLEALGPDSGWDEVVEADLAFHAALIAAAGSPRLARAWEALAGEIRLCLAQLRPDYAEPAEVASEHRELLDAIAARDAAAERLLRSHLEVSARRLARRA